MLGLSRMPGQCIELNKHKLIFIGFKRNKAIFRLDQEWHRIPRGEIYVLLVDEVLVDLLCRKHGKQVQINFRAPMSVQIHRSEAPIKHARPA